MRHMMHCTLAAAALTLTTACSSTPPIAPEPPAISAKDVVDSYADVAFRSYVQAYRDAVALREAVQAMIADPTDATLAAAREAWSVAHGSYGRTEAFRFYGGPIDAVDPSGRPIGPEPYLNRSPVTAAYLEAGKPEPGMIQHITLHLNDKVLRHYTSVDDEANVASGYHAIAFMLWGEGNRGPADFERGEVIRQRRRNFLTVATDMLAEDLRAMVTAWSPGREGNYRDSFTRDPASVATARMLTGLTTLTEHAAAAPGEDQVARAHGIAAVYYGRADYVNGPGLRDWLMHTDPELGDQLDATMETTLTETDVTARTTALRQQANLLRQAGEKLMVHEPSAAAE